MEDFRNILYTGDNLYILNGLNSNLVDLVYLDPPFNSKRVYSAPVGSKASGTSFKDIWTWEDVDKYQLEEMYKDYPDLVDYIDSIGNLHSMAMMSYITYMAQRVVELHRILKETGSLYYHCDPTAGHFVKLMLDGIFGKSNFRNEICWCYRQGGRGKSGFAKKHDLIFFYAKDIFFGDDVRIPYEGTGGYVNSGNGILNKETGVRYFPNELGKIPEDWWDIPSLNPNNPERVGYPTQKPLALLDRIIKASCPKNGIVLDPFCGCATTLVSAQNLGRKWIGIDIEDKAVDLLIQRLSEGGDDTKDKSKIKANKGMFDDFIATSIIPIRNDKIVKNAPKTRIEMIKFLAQKQDYKKENGQEKCKCNLCGNYYLLKDCDIDHIIPRAKGGQSCIENYQLLCGNCDRMKGKKTMEEARKRQLEYRKAREHNWFD